MSDTENVNLKYLLAGAEVNSASGGYSIGTNQAFDEFAKKRLQSMISFQYKDFDDYYYEIENYSTRADRAEEEMSNVDREVLCKWLRAAFECGRLMK